MHCPHEVNNNKSTTFSWDLAPSGGTGIHGTFSHFWGASVQSWEILDVLNLQNLPKTEIYIFGLIDLLHRTFLLIPKNELPTFKDSKRFMDTYPSITTERDIHWQREYIFDKLLKHAEQEIQFLIREPETQQNPDGHAEGKLLSLTVDIDRIGTAAPHP